MFKKYQDEDINNSPNPLLATNSAQTSFTFNMDNKDMKKQYDTYMNHVKYRQLEHLTWVVRKIGF